MWHPIRARRARRRQNDATARLVDMLKENERTIQDVIVDLSKLYYEVMLEQAQGQGGTSAAADETQASSDDASASIC